MPSAHHASDARILLVLTAATALQNAKDYHGASYDAALVEPRPSKACGGGLGVFAVTEVPPGARLAEIPVEACLTADAARAVLGGEEAESYAAQRELTRALLAHLRFGNNQSETCAAQKALCRLAALGHRRRRQTKGRVAADDHANRGPGRRRGRRRS